MKHKQSSIDGKLNIGRKKYECSIPFVLLRCLRSLWWRFIIDVMRLLE